MNKLTFPTKIKITDTYWFFDDCFFEKGMIFDIIKLDLAEIEDYCLVFTVTYCQKKYKEYNRKFLTESYYENIHTPKNIGRELFNAEEAGLFTDTWTEYIEVRDGENLIEVLFRGIEQTNFGVTNYEIH